MYLHRQVIFWSAALLVSLFLLHLFSPVLLPFLAGMAVAYALDPVADMLERLGLARHAATLVILAIFVLVLAAVFVIVVPILANQFAGLIQAIPGYAVKLQTAAMPLFDGRLAKFLGLDPAAAQASLANLSSQAVTWMTAILLSVWAGGRALLDIVSLMIITPVVAFYLLYDWDRMTARIDALLPREHADTIRRLGSEMSLAIAHFVRGQGLTCLIIGVFYAVGLMLLQVNFGFLIGFGAGILSFIPYVGTGLGFIVAIGVACLQFWPDWAHIGGVVALCLAGQFLEGNILGPRLVGHSVGLHPVWLMFALFAFGYFFGFVGLLVAVPASAAIAVLIRFGISHYVHSSFYLGGPPALPPLPPAEGPDRGE